MTPHDGDVIRALALASSAPLRMPVRAVGAFGGSFTASGLQHVSAGEISVTELVGVGPRRPAGPDQLIPVLLQFLDAVDRH